jgi:hypothetical protein
MILATKASALDFGGAAPSRGGACGMKIQTRLYTAGPALFDAHVAMTGGATFSGGSPYIADTTFVSTKRLCLERR